MTPTSFTALFVGFYWRGSEVKHASGQDDCNNKTITSLANTKCIKVCWAEKKNTIRLGEIIYISIIFYLLSKIDLTLCEFLYLVVVVYLISIVLLKWETPYSKRSNFKHHSNLIALYLSTAADIYDFVEYGMVREITETLGLAPIYGNKKET